MDAYDRTYDRKQRADLARRFQCRIDADIPASVTYERDFIYAFSAAVTGFAPTALSPFSNSLEVDIQP
jgi:hypothetical protein